MTDPLQLEAEVKRLQARIHDREVTGSQVAPCEDGLVQGLIKQFGLGGNPELRRACYIRLQALERQHGQKAEMIIAEARSMAMMPTIRAPGNYFVRAVLLKLREAGLV